MVELRAQRWCVVRNQDSGLVGLLSRRERRHKKWGLVGDAKNTMCTVLVLADQNPRDQASTTPTGEDNFWSLSRNITDGDATPPTHNNEEKRRNKDTPDLRR